MSAIEFTDEQIQAFKVESAKKHDGRAIRVDIDEPVGCTVVVAPFTRAEWARHVDLLSRDRHTAQHGAVISQLLYPGLQELEALRRDWATLPEHVERELMREAGMSGDMPVFRLLDPASPPMGMTTEKATELQTANKGARLWALDIPAHAFGAIMKTPIADTWHAAGTQEDAAKDRHSGIVAAAEPFVMASIIWSSEPLIGGSGLLDRKPALHWDLMACYRVMGGYGAAVRRKSL